MHQQLQLAVALAVVLLFAGSSAALAEPWALTAGEAACPELPYCKNSYDVCLAYAAGSYFVGPDSPPFVNSTSPQRQLAAAPFRFDGEGSFEGLSMIFSRKKSDDAVFSLAVFFYEANATNPSLPGDVLPGWEGGRAIQVSRSDNVSPAGATITAPFYRVAGAITPSFNLSAGTYFLSVASFGSKPSSNDGSYRIAGSNITGTHFAAYLGIRPKGTIYPALQVNATDAWTVPDPRGVLACVWPTGTVHRPQGGNTTNTTTTTAGNTTTTAGTTTTTTTAGNTTTTTGGSGGGSNPTDYLVRYPLATDLNSLSPAGFISGVSATLQLPLDAQIEIVAARRAQVTITTSSAERASAAAEQGTLLDFFVSGTDGASFMEKALSAKLADLRANNVSIASAPTTVTADASSGALLRPAALVSVVVEHLLLLPW